MYTYTAKQKCLICFCPLTLVCFPHLLKELKLQNLARFLHTMLCFAIFDFEASIYIVHSDILLTVGFFQSKHSFMKNITDICLKYVGVLGLVYIARFVFRRNNSTTPCDRVALSALSI